MSIVITANFLKDFLAALNLIESKIYERQPVKCTPKPSKFGPPPF